MKLYLETEKKEVIFSLFSILIFILGLVGLSSGTKIEPVLAVELSYFLEENFSLVEKNTLTQISNPTLPEYQVVKTISVVVTAYSSTPWETDGDPNITAAGTWVRDGIIANNLLPFGTKVKIPEIYGDKVFVVEDRMNSRKGYYHIDIWFPSYWEAKNFGAKRTYIEVLEG